MIKGINKQILEVTNTESPYFEKIIFFVRPEAQRMDERSLQKEAEKISKDMKKPPKTKRTVKQIASTFVYMLLGLGAGTALTFILNNLIK
ncbi:MAG: hypothetical protein ACLUFN_09295 [Eubacterium sp.]